MSTEPKSKICFFKPICNHDFIRRLRLPPIIGLKYGDILPEKVKLRTSSGGTWNVKLERTVDDQGRKQYCFSEGWSGFAEESGLELGEFVMFCFREENVFDVSVFKTNECEREIPGRNIKVEDSDVDGEFFELSKDCKKRKSSGSTSTKRSKASKTAGKSKALEEGNPIYFQLCLKKYHIHSSRVSLPKNFWVSAGLKDKETVKVQYLPKGDIHQLRLDHRSYRIDLSGVGWREFRKSYLICGKTYSFEFNPDKGLIQVKDIGARN